MSFVAVGWLLLAAHAAFLASATECDPLNCTTITPITHKRISPENDSAGTTCRYNGDTHDHLCRPPPDNVTVKYIDLSRNDIRFLPRDYFRFIPAVTTMDLSYNQLTELPNATSFGRTFKSSNIILTNNSITDINDLSDLNSTGVETIILSRNKINNLESQINLPSLINLDLSHNVIGSMVNYAFRYLAKLRSLNLSYNAIDKLGVNSFGLMASLEVIDVSHNKLLTLGDFSFVRLVQLRTLNVSDNKIRSLSRRQMLVSSSSISTLDLSRNSLRYVDRKSFEHMRRLSTLHLGGNAKLGTQTVNDLIIPKTVRGLDVSRCGITTVTNCDWQTGQIERLGLEGNVLDCGCGMLWVWYWYKQKLSSTSKDAATKWRCYGNKSAIIPYLTVIPHRLVCDHNASVCPLIYSPLSMKVAISTDKDEVTIEWVIGDFRVLQDCIFGYRVKTSTSGSEASSEMLHKTARSYVTSHLLDFSTYEFCVVAYKNETERWASDGNCASVYANSMSVVTGAIAAAVFLTPCVVIIGCLLYKDKQYHRKLAETRAKVAACPTCPPPEIEKPTGVQAIILVN